MFHNDEALRVHGHLDEAPPDDSTNANGCVVSDHSLERPGKIWTLIGKAKTNGPWRRLS